MPHALVTGIRGQDGRFLAEFLHHEKGYDVTGIVPGVRAGERLEELPFVDLVPGDLRDRASLVAALESAQPDEVYNLGGVSFVALSFREPELAADVNGIGVLRLLEAIRAVRGPIGSPIRVYQASSSEIFGKAWRSPQDEDTPLRPATPYGLAKTFGHQVCVTYRETYRMFTACGILYNHESERRGIEFVTRKVTNGVARIALGLQSTISLGDLDARRDWGFAGDYVRAMWLMLQQPEPGDYVIATGETHSVREFAEIAFKHAGVDDWERHVATDARFLRPAEVGELVGDASKARRVLGWEPTLSFGELVARMVDHDLKLEETRAHLPR